MNTGLIDIWFTVHQYMYILFVNLFSKDKRLYKNKKLNVTSQIFKFIQIQKAPKQHDNI